MANETGEARTELEPEKKDRRGGLFSGRRHHSMHAWHNLLLAAGVYILIVCIAVMSLVLPDRAFSESENRPLAQAPKFSSASLKSGAFFSGLSSYLQDQLAGRDGWVSARIQEEKLVGRRQSGDVYLGKNGYLLESPVVPDQQKTVRSAEMIRAFAEAYPNLHMAMTLVPCAAAVFPELLPKGAPVRDQLADINAFVASLNGAVSFVDMYGALRNDSENQVFYRTDHHWTSRGALDGFRALEPEMGIGGNDAYRGVLVSDSFEGTLSSQTGSRTQKDSIEVFLPEDSGIQYYTYYSDTQEKVTSLFVDSKLDEKDQYQVFFGGNHPVIQIRTTADTGKNLLVFKDSYANSFIQFLVPHYDRIVVIDPRYYYENVTGLINSEGITDVLFLYSMNIFADDSALSDVLQAAVSHDYSDAGMTGQQEQTGEVPETETMPEEQSGEQMQDYAENEEQL